MNSSHFRIVFVLMIYKFLCFHPVLIFGENQNQSAQEESEEIQNGLVGKTMDDYGKGFQDILSFFDSINKTISALTTRIDNLQEEIISVKNNTKNSISDLQFQISASNMERTNISNMLKTLPIVLDTEKNILSNPHARLFTGTNRTGNSEKYDSRTPTVKGGCYNVKNYAGQIKSIDTMGKCVRLFSIPYCYGWSQAFYPGSSTEFNTKLNGVYSVGPCVDNEFKLATIVNAGSFDDVEVHKVESPNTPYKSVPDFVGDYHTRSGLTSVSSDLNPIQHYLLGHGNRIEALAGNIFSRHIRTLSQAESNRIAGQSQSFYRNLAINNNTDEMGFAFPLELAGPADQIYNVFPQDRIQAEKYKQTIVPSFKQFLTENTSGHVYFTLSFFYENATSLRPKAIWYWYYTHSNGVNHEFRYAYFPN